MKKLKYLSLLFACFCCTTSLLAQPKKSGFDEMMRSNGRIYVVVAVMATILVGLIIYIIILDRKIGKLEKE